MTKSDLHSLGDCFAGVPQGAWKGEHPDAHAALTEDCLGGDIHLANINIQKGRNPLPSKQPSKKSRPAGSCKYE